MPKTISITAKCYFLFFYHHNRLFATLLSLVTHSKTRPYMDLTLSCFILGCIFFFSRLFSFSSILRCFSGSSISLIRSLISRLFLSLSSAAFSALAAWMERQWFSATRVLWGEKTNITCIVKFKIQCCGSGSASFGRIRIWNCFVSRSGPWVTKLTFNVPVPF
jgi:hypothetical protein